METLMRMQEGGEDDQNEDHVATLEERVSGLDLGMTAVMTDACMCKL